MYQGSTELQKSLEVTSPRKCLTKKYSWSKAEDRAAVQFIAMHKAEQATEQRVASHETGVWQQDMLSLQLEFSTNVA